MGWPNSESVYDHWNIVTGSLPSINYIDFETIKDEYHFVFIYMSSFYPIDLSLLNYTTPVDLVYSNYRNSTVL